MGDHLEHGGPGLLSAMDTETICRKGNLRYTRLCFNLPQRAKEKAKQRSIKAI